MLVCVCDDRSSFSLLKSSMAETSDRWRSSDVHEPFRKPRVISLRPAPLFRTVGLSGLSASLPPHRRLRSVLRKSPNTPAADGVQSVDPWTRSGRGFLSDSAGGRDPGPSRSHPNPPSQTEARPKPLPSLKVKKTLLLHACPPNQRRQTARDKEIFIHKPTDVPRRKNSGWINSTARSHETRTEEEYLFEEVWRGERQKVRWTGAKRNQRVNTETDQTSDISQWIQRLEITHRDRNSSTHSRWSRSERQLWFEPRGRDNRPAPLDKGEEQRRRDRRPHFLPPITQSDGLLNVPLVLPDNSPPPSPCSPSDILFFPLSVPHIQPFPLQRETDGDL